MIEKCHCKGSFVERLFLRHFGVAADKEEVKVWYRM
jgi:hypothetical protein